MELPRGSGRGGTNCKEYALASFPGSPEDMKIRKIKDVIQSRHRSKSRGIGNGITCAHSNNTKIATEAGCALCSENLQQISANLVPSAATDLKSSREQVLVWIFQ